LLAREYGEWALQRAQDEYGVVSESAGLDEQLTGGLDLLLEGRARLYLAEVGDAPAGIVGLKPLSDEAGEIKHLFVRPAFRGLGIARALLQQLISDAETLGYLRLLLETTAFMAEAKALYRSFGFVETSAYEGGEFGAVPGAAAILSFMVLELPIG
jgi:GNAT superfamily N-acetyltransferase